MRAAALAEMLKGTVSDMGVCSRTLKRRLDPVRPSKTAAVLIIWSETPEGQRLRGCTHAGLA
ncbi:hypothetical protein GRO01_04510 [Gluconobacter roseus NBRC 3990]|uniref:Uncharacterized protein n=1 Tax=Gluconobacter roseus NBRC 3990 TaxID=1307950 RepID=A0A4Y3M2M6_9PROT|nr:hypothetical protein AA3990_0998 [Gluconobacter roseus NBRC 3990]GEB02875.1 hypothetical protein GRO01_04510 [Gluconobacter roseus NBRC 3990]GLP93334.1 hypothetical protein GCM10007871_13120 [Gluconobacter roseus NBRC 3990]